MIVVTIVMSKNYECALFHNLRPYEKSDGHSYFIQVA